MVSQQILKNTIREIHSITGRKLAVFDREGRFVSGEKELEQQVAGRISFVIEKEQDVVKIDPFQLYRIEIEDEPEFVLVMEGTGREATMIGKMACSQIRTVIQTTADQYNRNSFIQGILMGNLLPMDIYSRAKKLHIEKAQRTVFVIDTGKKNNDIVLELVKNLSDIRTGDFVTAVDKHSVVLVKHILQEKEEEIEKALSGIAASLVDNIHMEAMVKVRVGYGNAVTQIQEISQSYQEAKMALEVGRIFYDKMDIISYGKLGIGRLIYQLPMSLCEMYIKEVFGNQTPEILNDEEAMSTINRFFENDLNISETARQLYVHRNTLVYRLERIEKAIGLDIRKFDEAMTFRIAVMVLAHMKENRK